MRWRQFQRSWEVLLGLVIAGKKLIAVAAVGLLALLKRLFGDRGASKTT